MNIAATQKPGQTIPSEPVTQRPLPLIPPISRQTYQNPVSKPAAVGDRVELSAPLQYAANLIFEKIAAQVAQRYDADAAQQLQFPLNLDPSSEATAKRVFTFATGFYPKSGQSYAGADEKEALKHFMSTLRGAVDQGFGVARTILAELSRFTPEIEEMLSPTYERLQDVLNGFEVDPLKVLSEVDDEPQKNLTDGLLFPPPEISHSMLLSD